MFFHDRITGIKDSDNVLEVGPGGTPNQRSNVLLERIFDDPELEKQQRGLTPDLKTDKKIVFYDGGKFPFRDKEFDYVICSHVLEHVDDVDFFLAEVERVGVRGYIEYPRIYYEYLYNFKVHKNLILRRDDVICWLKKSDIGLDVFFEVQKFFYKSLVAGHNELVSSNLSLFFEGFEWNGKVSSSRVYNIEPVCLPSDAICFENAVQMKADPKHGGIFMRLLKRLTC